MRAEAVAAPCETTVEVVLPEGGSCLQLSCSGWSWVPGVDAVGGSPHGHFTDDADVELAVRRCPNRLRAVLTGLISNVIGKVDHQPGPLGQILTPSGMIMKRLRNSGKPGQRPIGVCGFWEYPARRPYLPLYGVRGQRRLFAGGGVGAPRSQRPTRGDVLLASATMARW
jgi:hypothetical protein